MTYPAFFLTQLFILAGLTAVVAHWLHSTLLPFVFDLSPQPSPLPHSFYHEKCNITFAHTPISPYLSSPSLLVPQGNLEWKDHSCLLQSAISIIFYHLSCLLFTGALMIVFSVFLIMCVFVLDLLILFWRGMVDGATKE